MGACDWVGLVVSYVRVFAAPVGVGAGEGLRLIFKLPRDFTRKFVHVGVGFWVIGTVLLFQNWCAAIVPPLSFIVLSYVSYRREVFKTMELEDKSNLGRQFAFPSRSPWSSPYAGPCRPSSPPGSCL